jgi:hypothetical protein
LSVTRVCRGTGGRQAQRAGAALGIRGASRPPRWPAWESGGVVICAGAAIGSPFSGRMMVRGRRVQAREPGGPAYVLGSTAATLLLVESVVKGIDRRGSRRWTRSAPRSVGAKNAPPKRGKLVRLGSAQGQFQRAIRWGTERSEPLSIAKVFWALAGVKLSGGHVRVRMSTRSKHRNPFTVTVGMSGGQFFWPIAWPSELSLHAA